MTGSEDGFLVSTFSTVLPENIISSAYFLNRGVGAVFVSTNRKNNTTRKVTLFKNSDSSVKIHVTVHTISETDIPPPDNILIQNVRQVDDNQPTTSDVFTQLFTGCSPIKQCVIPMCDRAAVKASGVQNQCPITNQDVNRCNVESTSVGDVYLHANPMEPVKAVPDIKANVQLIESKGIKNDTVRADMNDIVNKATAKCIDPQPLSNVANCQAAINASLTRTSELRKVQLSKTCTGDNFPPISDDITNKNCHEEEEIAVYHDGDNGIGDYADRTRQRKEFELHSADTLPSPIDRGESGQQSSKRLVDLVECETDSPDDVPDSSNSNLSCRNIEDCVLRGNANERTDMVDLNEIDEVKDNSDCIKPSGKGKGKTKCEKNHSCVFCEARLKDYQSVLEHVRVRHATEPGVSAYLKQVRASARVPCDTCGKLYSGHAQLALHARLMHAEHTRAQCARCGISVKSAAHLRSHEQRVHADADSGNLHLCHLCPARLKQRSYLATHIKRVHGNASHRCEYCGQIWSCAHYLAKHIQHVHAAPRFACQHCARPFATDGNRRRHEKLIHGSNRGKEHECAICHKRFTLPANLKHHHRTVHLQQFRYACSVCGAGFSRQKAWQQHQLTHSALVLPPRRAGAVVQKTTTPVVSKDSTPSTVKIGGNVQYIVATPQMLKVFNTT